MSVTNSAFLAEQETPEQPVERQPEKQQARAGRYVATACAAAMGLCFVTGLGNFRLDPMNFDVRYQAKVAGVFNEGRTFAVYDPNLELRGLRRQHLRSMKTTPDVLLFAGSRFQEATADLLPQKNVTFYNAFVHDDYSEDYLAIGQLLIETQHLPKLLVLSVRYRSFYRPEAREGEEAWKAFAPEARAMAARLGVDGVGWLESLPFKYWRSLVSLPSLARNLGRAYRQHDAPPPTLTVERRLDDYDVLAADGSIGFSRRHLATWTDELARADAMAQASKARRSALDVDPARLAGFTALLDELRRRGVQVAVAITPHHPLYWSGIAGSPFGRRLVQLEREVYALGAAHGATVFGTFDPARAGCTEPMFLDYIHYRPDCLKLVFRGMPPLAR
jgi:hypothetical protein